MPSVTLHTRPSPPHGHYDAIPNNLPSILQTPSGLAILEIQGTIHAPFPQIEDEILTQNDTSPQRVQTPIGKLEFPLFDPKSDPSDTRWMKRVYLYVGRHQRLTGEVKKLPKPLVVISKRAETEGHVQRALKGQEPQPKDELEILEIVKHKILFGGRPEPVGD